MAHYRVLFIGNPNNIYSEELNLFDDSEGNSGELADYGHEYEGLAVENKMVSTAKSSNIDWDKSMPISAIYREDNKKLFIGSDGIGNPIDYNNNKEMLEYIDENDECTLLDVHL